MVGAGAKTRSRPADKPDRTEVLRDRVYGGLRDELIRGRYLPGEKLTIRALAAEHGTSLTPVREALYRLLAEGVLEGEANRSVRIPMINGGKVRELRDIRIANEGLAAARAAENITAAELKRLRVVAAELAAARERGAVDLDMLKLTEFQLGVYRASHMPQLMRIIESLWLQTGPYLRLLYPGYIRTVKSRRGDWRARVCAALEAHDAAAARREIEYDVGDALEYLATLAYTAEMMGARAAR